MEEEEERREWYCVCRCHSSYSSLCFFFFTLANFLFFFFVVRLLLLLALPPLPFISAEAPPSLEKTLYFPSPSAFSFSILPGHASSAIPSPLFFSFHLYT